ncbi:MAG: hypothetical protein WEC14_10115 [Chloroflexota bacterium]
MTTMTRRTALILGSSLSLLLAACGGGGSGDGDAASARPAQEQTTIAAADAATPFALQAGRYKFGWDAPDCKGVDFTMTGTSQGFTYAKTSALPKFSAIVSDVPEDTYMLTQADAECTDWTVRIDRVGS